MTDELHLSERDQAAGSVSSGIMGREIKVDDAAASSPVRFAVTKAIEGGTSGAMAMAIQVTSLMWMRTTMNYQYRYGTTTTQAMRYVRTVPVNECVRT